MQTDTSFLVFTTITSVRDVLGRRLGYRPRGRGAQ